MYSVNKFLNRTLSEWRSNTEQLYYIGSLSGDASQASESGRFASNYWLTYSVQEELYTIADSIITAVISERELCTSAQWLQSGRRIVGMKLSNK